MSEWKEVIEEGHVFYVSDDGTIAKLTEDSYVGIVPATAKLGPFETLEQAKSAIDGNSGALREYISNFNEQLMKMMKAVKNG